MAARTSKYIMIIPQTIQLAVYLINIVNIRQTINARPAEPKITGQVYYRSPKYF